MSFFNHLRIRSSRQSVYPCIFLYPAQHQDAAGRINGNHIKNLQFQQEHGQTIGCLKNACKGRLMEKLSPEETLFHINRGLHSGFPSCCVRYFLFRVTYFTDGMTYLSHMVRRLARYDRFCKINYVRCPRCILTNRVVEAHECSWACCGKVGHNQYTCFVCDIKKVD